MSHKFLEKIVSVSNCSKCGSEVTEVCKACSNCICAICHDKGVSYAEILTGTLQQDPTTGKFIVEVPDRGFYEITSETVKPDQVGSKVQISVDPNDVLAKIKAPKFYKSRIILDVFTEGKPKPHKVDLIQSPGGLPNLFDCDDEWSDPRVVGIKVDSSELLSDSELRKEWPHGLPWEAEEAISFEELSTLEVEDGIELLHEIIDLGKNCSVSESCEDLKKAFNNIKTRLLDKAEDEDLVGEILKMQF